MRLGAVPVCLAALALMASRTPLTAQAIRGIVVDDTNLARVSGATVRLVVDDHLDAGTETDDEGRFRLPVPGEGEYRLEVTRLGYATARSQPVWVPDGDTISVEFRVAPDALLLDPLTVTGRSRRGRNAFQRRAETWHRGVRLGQDQVAALAPRHPAELFRAVDDVVVHWGWGELSTGAYGRVPSVRTFLGRGCMLYMVDWMVVTAEPWAPTDWQGFQLNSLAPDDIVAVEVYRSYNEVPPELQRFTHRYRPLWSASRVGVTYDEKVNCGLTVFWTRSGW